MEDFKEGETMEDKRLAAYKKMRQDLLKEEGKEAPEKQADSLGNIKSYDINMW